MKLGCRNLICTRAMHLVRLVVLLLALSCTTIAGYGFGDEPAAPPAEPIMPPISAPIAPIAPLPDPIIPAPAPTPAPVQPAPAPANPG